MGGAIVRYLTLLAFQVVPLLIAVAALGANAQVSPERVTRLSLRQAVGMALSPRNAPLQLAETGVDAAHGKVVQAEIATSLVAQIASSEHVFRVDLRALGIDLPQFSQLVSSVQFPGARGPYTLFDPRIEATKTLIDKTAKAKIAIAKEGMEEAKSAVREDREKIAAEVARVYFDAVRAAGILELARRNLHLAETMQEFAQERHANGLATESDLRHAQANLTSERQKISSARLEQSRAVLRLVYLLGADFGDTLELTDELSSHRTTFTLDQAVTEALRDHPRLATLNLHDETLRLTDQAIQKAWLPVVSAYGQFGFSVVGPDPAGVDALARTYIYTAGVEVKMPLLDGHRRALAQAGVLLEQRQQQLKERDLRRQIELSVRLAFAALTEASTQAELADEGYRLAEADVAEVRANRAAGNASGLDVQQAEAREAAAADGRLAAFHGEAQARLALAEAMGKVEELQW